MTCSTWLLKSNEMFPSALESIYCYIKYKLSYKIKGSTFCKLRKLESPNSSKDLYVFIEYKLNVHGQCACQVKDRANFRVCVMRWMRETRMMLSHYVIHSELNSSCKDMHFWVLCFTLFSILYRYFLWTFWACLRAKIIENKQFLLKWKSK